MAQTLFNALRETHHISKYTKRQQMRNGLARKSLGRLESRVSLLSEQGGISKISSVVCGPRHFTGSDPPEFASTYNVYFDDECKITWI